MNINGYGEFAKRVNDLTAQILAKRELDRAYDNMLYAKRKGGFAYKQARATWERKKREYDKKYQLPRDC